MADTTDPRVNDITVFPQSPHPDGPYGGMMLRDLFAAAALTGFCSLSEDEVMGAADTAKAAYNFADAMLRERGK